MAAAAEVQTLLRFLSQDAKVPLATALAKVTELRKASLSSPDAIAKSNLQDVQAILVDEKLAKQVLNAAKRSSKKRSTSDAPSSSTSKRARVPSQTKDSGSGADLEAGLALPVTRVPEQELDKFALQTNRAPLVLAFAVTLLKYTMPEQPLSSRLSLAQAVVSANSRSKAQSIGLETGKSAEDEGWGKGQPKSKIMGREIPVMRRAGYFLEPDGKQVSDIEENSEKTAEGHILVPDMPAALWGLDLEALRRSNGPLVAGKNAAGQSGLPIYTPQAARNYLVRSFAILDVGPESSTDSVPAKDGNWEPASASKKKQSSAQIAAQKEEAAALLLKALDMLCESWASTLDREELDRRAWSWYLHTRPDVAQGQAGWGQKGKVQLKDVLRLRKAA